MKEISPMADTKIYVLAELTILPGCLEEVKAIFKEALIPTLQEPGCEALYETGRKDDPHKLVFFEVFSSAAAHEFHLEQDYTKRMFASLDGKLSGVPTLTTLSAL
jgi:quinol monooxygenase YgiN